MSPDSRRGRLARMPLRGRLTVLTAAAVAVAVVVFAFASWFFAKQQMMNQVRDSLQQNAPANSGNPADLYRKLSQWCAGGQPFDQAKTTPTVIFGNGKSCPTNDDRAVVITQADLDVAKSKSTGPAPTSTVHTGQTQQGTPVLVYTVSIGQFDITDSNQNIIGHTTAAVAFSASLEPVNHALTTLAVILATIALIVILGAAALAAWVARAALKPVDKLTEAVEHIARTEELGTTIPVEGKDEIARLSESFNSMSTALASSRERQSQLIADAGHELRTPLTSLRTNVDLLVRSEETGRALPVETHSKLLRNMKAQMGELSTLIGDLLELSRPARPKGSNPLQVVALHDIVTRALERARLRGPGLRFDVVLEPWYVRADPHTLERAVINLLDNAVKFSPAEGAIEVRLKFGELTVRDHGPGIPVEDLPHVFERFWRSPSARQLPGSGLGLAIVAQTIRDAGGEVSLATVSPGTLATVRLPGAPTPPPELPLATSTM